MQCGRMAETSVSCSLGGGGDGGGSKSCRQSVWWGLWAWTGRLSPQHKFWLRSGWVSRHHGRPQATPVLQTQEQWLSSRRHTPLGLAEGGLGAEVKFRYREWPLYYQRKVWLHFPHNVSTKGRKPWS